ncbi:MAG: putative metalloprotease CJM1_0395 family protein [Syntrophobacteraceae bacterium]
MNIAGLNSLYHSWDIASKGQDSSGAGAAQDSGAVSDASQDKDATEQKKTGGAEASTDQVELSREAKDLVEKLKARDQEVRTHEQAHIAAGGGLTGAASFTYEQGPDGNRYAVGGEVSIDMSAVSNDPQATIDKMRIVKRAALAPADPSSQDRSVAVSADSKMQEAQQTLARLTLEKLRSSSYSSAQTSSQKSGESTGQNLSLVA